MNKLVISLAIASALGLSGCDSETIKDVQQNVVDNQSAIVASARVVFDPSNGKLSVPNDLLFTGTTDGTLNIPVADAMDFSDPQNALNILDGWSTQNPFLLNIDVPVGTSLDANSVFNPASIHIFEAVMGGDLTDADCTSVQRGLACKIVGELTFGVDFVAQAKGNAIAVVPLKPLKSATTYILALTNNLEDDNGKAVAASATYELVRQDITSKPLGSAAQLGLQAVINSFEAAVSGAGVDKEALIYTMAMTTQSVGLVLNVHKKLLASGLNPDPAQVAVPLPVINVADTGLTVSQALIGAGLLDPQNPAHAELIGLQSAAKLSKGSISLPYYLSAPSAENPTAPLNQWWKARCDSGAMLAGLAATHPEAIPATPVSANDGFCMAFGLRDLGIDTERNLTKFNPIPAATMSNTLDVQMTVPDLATVNYIRASKGLPAIAEPEHGWPVVIVQHGVWSQKEHMLMVTGTLSLFGLATIAIDHPLHNSRAFGALNAAADPTSYMNLASLPTLRDNLRQSVADMLGLRFGINFLSGANIDKSRVHLLSQSLGSIAGVDFLSLANTPTAGMPDAVNALFKVGASTLAVPTQGLAGALLESPSYAPLLKGSLTMATNDDFAAAVLAAGSQIGVQPGDEAWASVVIATFNGFWQQLGTEQQAELNGLFSQFSFAAQTVLDSGDPTNYALDLASSHTPLHLIEVIGNGADNGPDRLFGATVSTSPLAGTEALIHLLGLPAVSETVYDAENTVSGVVRFVGGDHSSIFNPAPSSTAPDPIIAARAFIEMQTQAANFIASDGHLLPIVDSALVLGN